MLLHGLGMDGMLWRNVDLGPRRVVIPTLPLGSHRLPMRQDADLTLYGHARIVADFMDKLGLTAATVVQNDIGIAIPLATMRPDLVARLVLVSCEAFDNYPPGFPGKALTAAARISGALNLSFQTLRVNR
ncbi:alpha/beta fold hydrolase [Nonomuraea sp. NPDC050556]|uniref:alpha/beta fold hydrolase n=1 Tax=Nonomuraea sp. NPDC050556 TaxID=3364369 RepID=UPI0037AC3B10